MEAAVGAGSNNGAGTSVSTDLPAARLIARLAPGEPEFESRMRESLARAEKWLQATAQEALDPRVAALIGHLADAGGKRLRPLLVLLGAEFGDPWADGVTQAATIAELVHIASLYHDDVMDGAATRHGVPSVHARFGERAAVLGGDLLLARAAQLAADLGPAAVHLNARTAGRLVAGQLRELAGPGPDEDPVTHYFHVAAGKTAALLAMSLGIGAVQAGAPAPAAAALTEYGEQLGIAFQIADDLLDLKSPAGVTGKERGKDLLAGVASLPVLLARESTDPDDAELCALLAAGPVPPAALPRALELFERSAALAEAEAVMQRRLERARTALGALPALPARRALLALCDYVALRTS
ncbi:polyprenyl synthetase family protein [Streptomyces antimicrobicus]|uniref:Polyprenyl synthetase family protein n=1 Tax=Streptomyces antimicrobicus TaxID=2883108 RepID=A0ABS8BC24_9ACTN|nr:polyprenyl synthetase family protein [Streptomyces antimicrobicus]MCB5182188.1 polyprenyl synthetase family protein [Streptomyces antimicrobicus]